MLASPRMQLSESRRLLGDMCGWRKASDANAVNSIFSTVCLEVFPYSLQDFLPPASPLLGFSFRLHQCATQSRVATSFDRHSTYSQPYRLLLAIMESSDDTRDLVRRAFKWEGDRSELDQLVFRDLHEACVVLEEYKAVSPSRRLFTLDPSPPRNIPTPTSH